MEMIRKEVSYCDNFGGFLVLLSLAGGTGSGLGKSIVFPKISYTCIGTYITELLRDEYPNSFIVNLPVWVRRDFTMDLMESFYSRLKQGKLLYKITILF
jgi:hypothetical protein